MPLYEVTIRAYIAAESLAEATSFARYGALRQNLDVCDVEIYETHTVDARWANLIPFGEEDDDRTCMQILRGETR